MMLSPLVLAACVVIEGEQILISDLARAIPAFAAAPAVEAVGLAPTAGARRMMGRTEIGRLAARYGIAAPAADVCFERATEPLTEARVLEALRDALRAETANWALVDFSHYRVPRGAIEFMASPKTEADGPVLVRGRIAYGEGRAFPVWARVKITRPARDVERGDTVAVEVTSGAALIKFEARAETGGGRGEAVVLRNPATKTCFSAQVAGKGKVTLNANPDDSKQNFHAVTRNRQREPGR
jgi:hypothetical protein